MTFYSFDVKDFLRQFYHLTPERAERNTTGRMPGPLQFADKKFTF
jgi:hypothetical protein